VRYGVLGVRRHLLLVSYELRYGSDPEIPLSLVFRDSLLLSAFLEMALNGQQISDIFCDVV
jgi:hypothetical protein